MKGSVLKILRWLLIRRERIGLRGLNRRILGIAHIITSIDKLSEEDIRSWAFLQAEGGIHSVNPLGKTPKTAIFLFL